MATGTLKKAKTNKTTLLFHVETNFEKNLETKKKKTGPTIGCIGNTVIFETNDKKVLNFTKFSKTVKGRWAEHPRVGKKPKKQFMGPEGDALTFTVVLNAEHGVKPRKTVENIEKLIQKGTPQKVVIGKKAVGKNKFVITEMNEDWQTILNKGEVVKITCDLTLEEYL